MFIALIAYIAGILLARYISIPLWITLAATMVIMVIYWRYYRYSVSLLYAFMAILLTGFIAAEINKPHATLPKDSLVEMVIDVTSTPAQREGYSRADGKIVQWRGEDGTRSSNDKVVLWLRTDSIHAGDRVSIWGKLRDDISKHDEYNTLMHNREYVGSVAIGRSNIISIERNRASTLHIRATDKLSQYRRDSNAHAIMQTLVTGSRHAMTPQLRDDYTKTSLAHLLAVSGLHLGIVYMVVITLLKPLGFIYRGHLVADLLAIIFIWIFAVMSGLSAPIIRAAIMVSILQLSKVLCREYVSVNALCAALLIMLIYRPSYLYDISFELSALAVAGIVLWGTPLLRRIKSSKWIVRYLASSIVIGTMATLWTLPILSHTFGYITLASIALTPVVILFTYAIVFFGLAALMMPHPISQYLAMVSQWAAECQNSVVSYVARWESISIEYSLSTEGVAICYIVIAIISTIILVVPRRKRDKELIYIEPV